MQTPFSAYNEVAPQVYRETSGLYYEDFVVGDTFEHRPGRTITDTDNIWMTLLTMNTQPVHFDANYAATTEWKRLLVDSTLTIAMLTGMSVKTVSAKVVANLGWDQVEKTNFFTAFYIFHQSGIKTFIKFFINKCPKGTN